MRFRYPQPANHDEFEEFCVRFYRQLLKRGGLVRYGKSGEERTEIAQVVRVEVADKHLVQIVIRDL